MPVLRAALAALLTFAVAASAQAQAWPTRAVRIVVPFAPGGGNDLFARQIAPRLAEAWKQPVVVDNRAGAGGNIGTAEVAKSAPDGHTLLLGHTGTLAINPALYANLPFDAQRDLQPLVMFAAAPLLLVVVGPQAKERSVAELVTSLRVRPDAASFASGGAGTGAHLKGEMLALKLGMRLLHVAYKGTVPALTDLASGQVSFMFSVPPPALPLVKAGRLRALATTGAARLPSAPELPTMIESGLAEFESALTYGLIGPRGVPEAVQREVAARVQAAVALPDFQERLRGEGAVGVTGGAAEFAALVKAETAKWGAVVRAAGVKAR
jgi:tripartite-type tricarboxylate transporter receptor subunit TctC